MTFTPLSGYSTVQAHIWPVMLICMSGSGWFANSMIPVSPGQMIITTARAVEARNHTLGRAFSPRRFAPSPSGSPLERKRSTATTRMAQTSPNTGVAMYVSTVNAWSMMWASVAPCVG